MLPPEQLPGVPIKRSAEECTTYRTASGRVLANAGQQEITGQTVAGDKITARWQVVPGLKQPLMSLGKLAANGHRIILDDSLPGGGQIIHKASGRKIPLEKSGNTYEIDLYIDTPFRRPSP